MSRPNIEDLLDRYLAGHTTPEENRLLEAWLSDHDSGYSGWEELSVDSRKAWLDNLFEEIAPDAPVIVMRSPRVWSRSIAAIAASVILLLGAYLFFNHSADKLELATLRIPQHHTELLSLADGSKIWLNQGASLSYPKAFNSEKREVYLSGEAYFDIHHDAAKPFLIHSGKVVVTVLGTAFNVKADPSDGGIVVTVVRGKVSVADGGHLLAYLTPNRQLRYNTVTHQALQEDVAASTATNWQQQNEMHFEDMTFETAAKLLEQRFNVKISFVDNKIKNCRFSGTIGKGKDLDDILKLICAFNNANFHHDDKGNIIIDGKGCS